ncbi:MAG: hypothetical protein HY014_05515 [Acidobacteria bacterium]|nr:hypothetical protein [Acidobacteriota bacterium]MBI3487608.1 hypothetical protein [Acidobacteriota bacterium]
MNAYRLWVQAHPFLSAALQFGLLGTLGEVVASSLRARRFSLPCSVLELAAKAFAWALLGLVIKAGFAGMKGFTRALLEHHILPAVFATGLGWAFALSTLTNVFFGPQMMLFHRLEDNLILRRRGFDGMAPAIKTLVWFWIPAHTLTFSLPVDFQVGLAALWSLALGLILGLASARKSA